MLRTVYNLCGDLHIRQNIANYSDYFCHPTENSLLYVKFDS